MSEDRYTIHGDGTVTDTTTGLMWEYYPPKKRRTWDAARGYCGVLRLSGHTDWRMPTIHELFSLVDFSRRGPACVLPTAAGYYWSSTADATDPNFAWGVFFFDGFVGNGFKIGSRYVRAVRGGSSRPFDPLTPQEQAVIRAMRGTNLTRDEAQARVR